MHQHGRTAKPATETLNREAQIAAHSEEVLLFFLLQRLLPYMFTLGKNVGLSIVSFIEPFKKLSL